MLLCRVILGLSCLILNVKSPITTLTLPGSNDPDTYKLLWSSATSASPTMKYGTSTGVYTTKVLATTSHITSGMLCASPANSTGYRDLGLIHTAFMSGMTALSNSKVYYIFGDAATNDYSKEFIFNVPPAKVTNIPSQLFTRSSAS